MSRLSTGFFALILHLSTAQAQTTWYVDASAPGPGTGSQLDPYASVRYALEQGATLSGDLVLVLPGTYPETVDLLGKSLRIESTEGPDMTRLEPTVGGGSVVLCVSGEGVGTELVGFELAAGTGSGTPAVGGVLRVEGSSLRLEDCRLRDSVATLGGAAYVQSGNLRLDDCELLDNRAEGPGGAAEPGDGGALWIDAGSQLEVFGGEVRGHRARRGGAIFVDGGTLALEGVVVIDNLCEPLNASFPAEGGGIWIGPLSIATLLGGRVEGNVAEAVSFETARGGGICVQSAQVTLDGVVVQGNRAGSSNCFQLGTGGGLYSNCGSTVLVQGGVFEANHSCLAGGGLAGAALVQGTSFLGNLSVDGAGLASLGCFLQVEDALIEGNLATLGSATQNFGGGVNGPANVIDCDLVDNHVYGVGGGAFNASILGGSVTGNLAYTLRTGVDAAGGGLHSCTAEGVILSGNQVSAALWEPTFGGGAAISNLIDCDVRDNQALLGGGLAFGSAFGGRIEDNQAELGGGAYLVDLERVVLRGNTAPEGAALAGGFLTQCTATGNTADPMGGAAYSGAFAGPVTVRGSILWSNVGGSLADDGTAPDLAWSLVEGGASGPGILDLDPQFWNPVSGGIDLEPDSPCIDAGDPMGPLDSDGSIADLGARVHEPGLCGTPGVYCTAKLSSEGCLPLIGWTGTPTLSGPDDFIVHVDEVVSGQTAFAFWSGGPAEYPFMGGTNCIEAPFVRFGPLDSGPPAGPCEGRIELYFDQVKLQDFGLGTRRYVQIWFRDPAQADGTGVGLSAGVEFTVCP